MDMAVVARISVILIILSFVEAGQGEVCPNYCDQAGLFVASRDCGNGGYCCGYHNNMYCCVSYYDRVPTPVPVVGSAADCTKEVDNGAPVTGTGLITLGLPLALLLLI